MTHERARAPDRSDARQHVSATSNHTASGAAGKAEFVLRPEDRNFEFVTRKRPSWSRATKPLLDAAITELERIHEHWPVTLRKLFYALVSNETIANDKKTYSKLSRIVCAARLEGLIDWRAIEDRTRTIKDLSGYTDAAQFCRAHMEGFFCGYFRDLLQDQPEALEVWVEKDALVRQAQAVARVYQIPATAARGFSSLTFQRQLVERAQDAEERGKRLCILYLGDLDPSGMAASTSMMQTIWTELKCENVYLDRLALNPEHVQKYALPHNPDAVKRKDTRARKFIAKYGLVSVELDALAAQHDAFAALLRAGIERHLDSSKYENALEIERAERNWIRDQRVRLMAAIEEAGGAQGCGGAA